MTAQRSVAMPGRIRIIAPAAIFIVPLALIAMAALVRLPPCDGLSCVASQSFSWTLVLMAVPTALMAGIPMFGGPLPYILAIGSSIAMWVAVGRYAAEIATQDIDATWKQWGFEVGAITIGIWLGFVGMAIVGYVMLDLV